jgi:hypothetical protein
MSKLVQAFLSGVFFTFLLDFLIFLSIKLNYIDFHEINVYYNILFADHQNIYIYLAFTVIIGYIVVYLNNKVGLTILSILFIATSLTLIQPIGHTVGEKLLMKKNVTLHNKKHTFIGDIYYDGRRQITFYDYELKKMIVLNKKELK